MRSATTSATRAAPRSSNARRAGVFSVKNVERTNAFFERFGGLTIILARFVPIVRTFAPVAAGVGHMPWRRYTLYNLIGAVLWGFGLVMLGYVIGFVPVDRRPRHRVHRHHPAGRRRRHRAHHALALPQRAPQGEEGRRGGRGRRDGCRRGPGARARPRGLRPRTRARPPRRRRRVGRHAPAVEPPRVRAAGLGRSAVRTPSRSSSSPRAWPRPSSRRASSPCSWRPASSPRPWRPASRHPSSRMTSPAPRASARRSRAGPP